MIISLIAAMDTHRVIGKDNDIPWRLPMDWQYVKKVTEGHSIILGRKNYESIGRALPGRRNIILTKDKNYNAEGCEITHSKDGSLALCKDEDEIFIFGGEQIYNLFLPQADKLYLTKIQHAFEGDTFFPAIDYTNWHELSVVPGITNEKNPYTYHFHIYEKKEPTK